MLNSSSPRTKRARGTPLATLASALALLALVAPGARALDNPEHEDDVARSATAPALTADQAARLLDRLATLENEVARLKSDLGVKQAVPSFAAEYGKQVEDQEDRIEKLEVKAAKDRVQWGGQMRVTADSIHATMAERFDGLALQKGIVDTIFYYGSTGLLPMGPTDVPDYIASHYADYLYFQDGLSFDQLRAAVGMFPPEMQEALIGALLPATHRDSYDYDNDIIYTTKLELDLHADIKERLAFTGRLGMYKAWGDSTGVGVFNGFPNSFTIDGTNTTGTPNSDIVRVERAYFDWKHILGSNWYLSVGRRPSTEGPPLHIKTDQFDGITLGVALDDKVPGMTFRFCYGLGFESGWGNADQLQAPADRLDDVHFGGINFDIFRSDKTFVQTTILGAWGVTDGFKGLIVLPADPVSGNDIKAPVVLRYSPAANLGDIYLGEVLLERTEDNGIDWFLSFAYMMSNADNVTTPFGGLFSDPFDTPEDHEGWSAYAGVRFPIGEKDFLGFEYNHGSKYWFNFTQAADDLVGSKLATRGDVYDLYWTHEFKEGLGRARAKLLLSLMYYDFDYSGSGWNVGAPKPLDGDVPPILAFPTYSDAFDARLGLTVNF